MINQAADIAVISRPAAPSLALVHAIDVSSHQPRDLTAIIGRLEPRPTHIVVRLYLPDESPSQYHSLEQIKSTQDNGCSIGGYIWAYGDLDPGDSVLRALELAARAGVSIPCLWVDLEMGGLTPGWVERALDAADKISQPAGLYTATWWVESRFPGGWYSYRAFGSRPHWVARYNGVADLDVGAKWIGFTIMGKQYQGVTIDRDVFHPAVTQ